MAKSFETAGSMNTVFGLLRIKNEARWIERVVRAILPLCEKVFILDDHSTDGTPDLCENLSDKVFVFRSEFDTMDESRDREFLLGKAFECVPPECSDGNIWSPFWALAIDGDELLESGGSEIIHKTLETGMAHAYKLWIPYLWDAENQVRIDGVYARFARPSLFRLFNSKFRFQTTPFGPNLHCSSIPQELLHFAADSCPARLWHLGYMDREDRLRKYEWYNRVDPGNVAEDEYRHMVIGDLFPADSKFRHAGPLELRTL